MSDPSTTVSAFSALNTLAGGLFLLSAFGMVATRQVKACLNLFIAQSLLLAASAFLLSRLHHSWHLLSVGVVNVIAKPVLIPWILRRTVHEEVYTRREIEQAWNIPTSLLVALGLAILAHFLSLPLQQAVDARLRGANLPIGFAGLFLGAYTLTVRREAVPLLLGLLAMENGVFFAGIAISADLPLLVELAIVADGLIIVLIVGVLTRAVHKQIGTTKVGALAALKENVTPP